MKLKFHAWRMINQQGGATPPEAFVFRGNAYMALGQPYFALADFRIAADIMQLSGMHEKRATEAITQMANDSVDCVYCSSSGDLGNLVEPHLGPHVGLKDFGEKIGRGIVAKGPLLVGDVVIKATKSWCTYPLLNRRCSNCAAQLPARYLTCANEMCHEEYCSRECRKEASLMYHSGVCRNQEFQAVELDTFTALRNAMTTSEHNELAARLLALRIIAHSVTQRVTPMSHIELKALSGRLHFTPGALGGDLLLHFDKLVRVCGIRTAVSFEEYVGILARITANAFQTEDSISLHIPRSMLNHSNNANVAENERKQLVTTRPVEQGEQLTINYFPHLKHLDKEQLRVEMQRRGMVDFAEV